MIIYSMLISYNICSQIDGNNLSLSSKRLNLYSEEQKQLDEAYNLLGTERELDAYTNSLRLLKKTKHKKNKIYANIIIGIYNNDRNLADSALFYGNEVIKLVGNQKDSLSMLRLSSAYNIIANAYGDKSLLEESKKWHLKGIEIAQKYQTGERYFRKVHNLASTYIRLENYDYAIKLLESCLEYTENTRFTFTVYISLATAYSYKNDYELALSYLKKTLEYFKDDKGSRNKMIILQNIGAQYHLMKNHEEALSYYNEALVLGKDKKYYRPMLDAMNNIGLVYQDKGMHEKAKKAYQESLLICEKLGFLDKQIVIYNRLEESSKIQGKYQDAYMYFGKKIKIKDSINELQKDNDIRELEIKFKTLQKEKEIKFLQVENTNKKLELANREEAIRNLTLQQEIEKKESEIRKKENENKLLSFQNATEKTLNENILLKKNEEIKDAQLEIQQAETTRQKGFKNIILYSFLILLIPVIGLLVTYYQKIKAQSELTKKQEEINEERISSLLKDQELKVIKASIESQDKERKRIAQELHDSIGGNLAAIKLQLNNNKNKNEGYIKGINTQIDDTYELVRDLSHNLIPKKFSKNNFCDVLEEYFKNIGGASSLRTSCSVYPRKEIDLLGEELQIETFKIIQELITNSIKHAKASSIELQLNLVEDELSILFEDDGVGFDTNKNIEGIGFRNIRSRLNKISGTIDIDSRIKRGTIINIEITNLTTTIDEIQPNYS
ncbi:tetratricopeptide repeat protein [uncultured Aquimarina sp.]|uniref:tetratricopeptide repeat-containing sensor histidine kinase n=1 Tax=uncultured Aquimarina sp. TaxID=575652 RepID=UPI00263039DE|nr:tetratricopeptide repeat protein [uncultured Aquimarina sp.]